MASYCVKSVQMLWGERDEKMQNKKINDSTYANILDVWEFVLVFHGSSQNPLIFYGDGVDD